MKTSLIHTSVSFACFNSEVLHSAGELTVVEDFGISCTFRERARFTHQDL